VSHPDLDIITKYNGIIILNRWVTNNLTARYLG